MQPNIKFLGVPESAVIIPKGTAHIITKIPFGPSKIRLMAIMRKIIPYTNFL